MKTVAGVLKTFTKAVKHLEQIEREQTQRMVVLTTELTDSTREQQAAASIRRNINALIEGTE